MISPDTSTLSYTIARYTPIFLVISVGNVYQVEVLNDHEYTSFSLTSSKILIRMGVFADPIVPSLRIFLIVICAGFVDVTSISESTDPDCSRESE